MGNEIEVNGRERSEAACNALPTVAAPGSGKVGDGITAPLCRPRHQRRVPVVQETLWSTLSAQVPESARTALLADSFW